MGGLHLDPLAVGALILVGLAAASLGVKKRRHRGRSRYHRGFSHTLVSKIDLGGKEKPAHKQERLLRELREYQRKNPGATSMPLDTPPEPSAPNRGMRRAGRWLWRRMRRR